MNKTSGMWTKTEFKTNVTKKEKLTYVNWDFRFEYNRPALTLINPWLNYVYINCHKFNYMYLKS